MFYIFMLELACYDIITALACLDLNRNDSVNTEHKFSLYSRRLMIRLKTASCLLYKSHPFSMVVAKLEVSSRFTDVCSHNIST